MNNYDKKDMITRDAAIIAGPLKIAMYRVRDPETLEWSSPQIHMTFDNVVLAVLGESSAKLLAGFVADNVKDAGVIRTQRK